MNLQVVSITSQGQLTIPIDFREILGITSQTKAEIRLKGDELVVKPKKDFWSLGGSLKSKIKLTDRQLGQARKAFETSWAEK
jgi:bifunctional DNA-binding transcriptional regulator/antitoxin component of YhaV-PrlF toxin-antitoxin module